MAGLGAFLFCIAVTDLVRTSVRETSRMRIILALGVGAAFELGWYVWLDVPREGVWAWLIAAAALVSWTFGSAAALRSRALHGTILVGAASTFGLAAGVAAMMLAGSVAGAWPDHGHVVWAKPPAVDVDRALLVSALVLVQLSTANIMVRILLSAAGVPAESNETQVKGGRWLGPMERIFILGFGAAGEFTAASAVVAAKALLRLPEVNSSEGGADGSSAAEQRSRLAEHSEYLLLGSFTSWLIAAASVALASVHS